MPSTTVRTFPNASAAADFYNKYGPAQWDTMYNQLYGPGAKTGTTGGSVAGGASGVPSEGVLGGPYGWDPAYGGRVSVPDPLATAKKAIAGNTENWALIQPLADKINTYNLGQVTDQYRQGIPGYDELVKQSSDNISKALKGDLDYASLRNDAAALGIGSGTTGSGFMDVNMLKQTERERQARQAYGEQALSGAVARMPRTPLYDPASMFLTPDQMQDALAAQYRYTAAPDPKAAYENALKYADKGTLGGLLPFLIGGSPGAD